MPNIFFIHQETKKEAFIVQGILETLLCTWHGHWKILNLESLV
jgi:hypothetical protein